MLNAVTQQNMTNARMRFLKAVYTRYMDELSGYLRRSLHGNKDDADDMAHAAFTRLAAQKAPHKIDNPRAYLYQMARNLMIDQQRKQAREAQLNVSLADANEDSFDTHTPEEIALQREELNLLEQIIARLPQKRRRVFLLSRVHNMSYDDIAGATGLTKAGVKQHIVRALAEIRLALSSATTATLNSNSVNVDVGKSSSNTPLKGAKKS